MVDLELLKDEMKNKHITNSDIATCLNINLSTWSRKKASPNGIKIGEAERISKLLNLSKEKANQIFFGE